MPLLEERYWRKVAKREPDECWPWRGTRDENRYGVMKLDGKLARAHRLAWLFAHGEMPHGCILHRCDNPPCVNPAHLSVGSRSDNMKDMNAKGRHGSTGRLTPSDVRKAFRLRRDGFTQDDLARLFAVNRSVLSKIFTFKNYRNLTAEA